MTYLDYQATTPLAPEAFEAMLPWLRDQHANPHSPHRPGRTAKAAVEVARDRIAALCPPGGRLVFTSGATEALNWAIKGAAAATVIALASEHAAVLDSVASRQFGDKAILGVDGSGIADPARIDAMFTPRAGAGMLCAMLVNNEIGVVQPIADLADRAHDAGSLLLCDAVQGFGRVAIPAACDLIAISAHKIHGPKGIGALWIRDGVALAPLLHGGDQEGGRSGTLSPALCAGFGVAAMLMADRRAADAGHVERLWSIAADRFARAGWTINGATGNGTTGNGTTGDGASGRPGEGQRYHGNLNVRRDGLDVARLMADCRDIAFSAGSACASGSGRPSHVLRAIGLTDGQARSSIRLGWGRYTTEPELTAALDRLIAAAAAQDMPVVPKENR